MGKCVFRHMQTAKTDLRLGGLHMPEDMQSDQGFHCMLTESLDTTIMYDGEQRPR